MSEDGIPGTYSLAGSFTPTYAGTGSVRCSSARVCTAVCRRRAVSRYRHTLGSCLVTEKALAISASPASGISGTIPGLCREKTIFSSSSSQESRPATSPAGPKKRLFTRRRSGPGCHREPGHVPRGPRPGRAPRIPGTRCGRHGRCPGSCPPVPGVHPAPPVPHRNRRLPR